MQKKIKILVKSKIEFLSKISTTYVKSGHIDPYMFESLEILNFKYNNLVYCLPIINKLK
jgi:hypothetical protein